MDTKVLHGEGKPRIVIPDGSPIVSGTVAGLDSTKYKITISGTPTLTDTVKNRFCITKNAGNNETKGKIIAYDDANDLVIVESWDNLFPAVGKALTIEDKIIDLPYCESLEESFEFVFDEKKTYYTNRKKKRELKGFYYYASLDYSSFTDLDMLKTLQDVFDSTRGSGFYFYPRRDNSAINYLCELSPDSSFRIAQLRYHQGHKNVVIDLEGLELQSKIDLTTSLRDVLNNKIVMDESIAI